MGDGSMAQPRAKGGPGKFLALAAVVLVLIVGGGLALWLWPRPAPAPGPAALMPPGAAAYAEVVGLDRVWSAVTASKWFGSLATIIRSDPDLAKAWDRLWAKAAKKAPELFRPEARPVLLQCRFGLAVYPTRSGYEVLVAVRTPDPAAFKKVWGPFPDHVFWGQ